MSIEAEAEFEAFVRAEGGALFRLAVALTGHRSDGEDLLQSVLARVYLRWSTGHQPDFPAAYVRTALVHAAGRRWRRRATSPEHLMSELPDRPTGEGAPDPALRSALLQALRGLPARQRAAVALRYLDDRSERETAELMRCTVGTVKTLSHRGLRRLSSNPALVDHFGPAHVIPAVEA